MKINVPSNPDTQWLAFNISDASIQSLHTYLSWAKIYWIFKVFYSNILNTDTIYNLLSKSQPVQLSIFTQKFNNALVFCTDSLVQHLQFLYDGYFPGGTGQHDSHEDPEEGLRPLQQGGGPRWYGRSSVTMQCCWITWHKVKKR